MARFQADQIDNYGGQGGGGYFSLKNDKETARVRFMYAKPDDVEGFSVHEVEVDGKKRYVNCLRDYNDPLDVCPFCREHKPVYAKLFVPLYNIDEDKIQIWERGKKFYATLSGILARTRGHIASTVFEIERNGKPKDTATTYGIYPMEQDDIRLEDLPEVQDILGTVVLEKTEEEMDLYLDTGAFPSEDEPPVRRGGRRQEEEIPRRRTSERVERRIPTSSKQASAPRRPQRVEEDEENTETVKRSSRNTDEEVF